MDSSQSSSQKLKKVAIIGSDISGMFSAWALTQHSPLSVTIFEKSNKLFNYASTVDFLPPGIPEKCTIDFLPETRVAVDIKPLHFDSKRTPNLSRAIDHLRVETIASPLDYGMSKWSISEQASEKLSQTDKDSLQFSLFDNNNSTTSSSTIKPTNPETISNPKNNRRILRQNLWLSKREISTEWSSFFSLSLFSKLTNLFNPKFYRSLLDYYRFTIEIKSFNSDFFVSPDAQLPICVYLTKKGYSPDFFNSFLKHVIINSGLFFNTRDVGILKTWIVVHTMLQQNILSPQYSVQTRVIKGGSRRLLSVFQENLLDVRLNTNIVKIIKNYTADVLTSVTLVDKNNIEETFDYLIIAIPPNLVPPMFSEPLEKPLQDSLNSYHFLKNQYVLHADSILMPSSSRAWSTINSIEATIEGNTRNCCYVFVTINPVLDPNPRMVITTVSHKSIDLSNKKPSIFDESDTLDSDIIKFVGGWFGTGTLEDACYSGLSKAIQLGAKLPFELLTPKLSSSNEHVNAVVLKFFPIFYDITSTIISIIEKTFYVLLVAIIGILVALYFY
ncbi:hypothetical protein BB561_005773 [Smittium simulii]|uniref:Amine oxidase domain-containing protein n=1 Tax=Smittium simulii TaxID=133385 RepID=A0A2T9Y8C6_9FUNG|nr:hypothetical protein BB561_005773 [Smittium simulii]